jgi:hypothetical protein
MDVIKEVIDELEFLIKIILKIQKREQQKGRA